MLGKQRGGRESKVGPAPTRGRSTSSRRCVRRDRWIAPHNCGLSPCPCLPKIPHREGRGAVGESRGVLLLTILTLRGRQLQPGSSPCRLPAVHRVERPARQPRPNHPLLLPLLAVLHAHPPLPCSLLSRASAADKKSDVECDLQQQPSLRKPGRPLPRRSQSPARCRWSPFP